MDDDAAVPSGSSYSRLDVTSEDDWRGALGRVRADARIHAAEQDGVTA